jgi:hypothetical protein
MELVIFIPNNVALYLISTPVLPASYSYGLDLGKQLAVVDCMYCKSYRMPAFTLYVEHLYTLSIN